MKTLHCFFAYGRPELTEKCFKQLVKNIKPEDRLLVIDQESHNAEFFIKQDRIDWLFLWKRNYIIAPVWLFIYEFVLWQQRIFSLEVIDEVEKWVPDYINIVENDAWCEDGFMEKCIKGFEIQDVGIVSGFDSDKSGVKERYPDPIKGFKIKQVVSGVNVIMKLDYFLICLAERGFRDFSQDRHLSAINKGKGKIVAILPDQVKHLG